jgi:hypothetical protein
LLWELRCVGRESHQGGHERDDECRSAFIMRFLTIGRAFWLDLTDMTY